MKRFKLLACAVALGAAAMASTASAFIGGAQALPGLTAGVPAADRSEPDTTSVAARSMQCYTLYTMLMEEDPADPYRNNVLGSQAMLMGTIYTMNAGSLLIPVSGEKFDQANEIAQSQLLNTAMVDMDSVVQSLIDCEGWRESVLTYMALELEDIPEEVSRDMALEVLRALPKPRKNYALKGASRAEVETVIKESFSWHIRNRDKQ